MTRPTDIRAVGVRLHFIPVSTRVPLKFGTETLTSVTCARACVRVVDRSGRSAEGWGETPLSVQWVWPSRESYELRHQRLKDFCCRLGRSWAAFEGSGHPIEIGSDFLEDELPRLLAAEAQDARQKGGAGEPMPHLAALLACSVFDQAIHDAFGRLLQRPIYETYTSEFMSRDFAGFIQPAAGSEVSFTGRAPADFLLPKRIDRLPAWHLIGGLDSLDYSELTGREPDDGYPALLDDWIRRDGLKCLKIKLRGNDPGWDYERLVRVGAIASRNGVEHLSADFNCTVTDPSYVNAILDQLRADEPATFDRILYVEQPFPYDLEAHRIDVRGVSARKPLFLDESAHDWRQVRLGRELGWTGVALKTCKTQTGALLSACWAKAHGMQLMVQDLTNPMLAQIPHLLLAAHVGTIAGVETNAMQFYPDASAPEAAVHPGAYRRRGGIVDLSTVRGPGFGYQLERIQRTLPDPVLEIGW